MNTSEKITFINGKIFTSDDRMPDAWAMTIANGRIAAIGREEDCH